MTERHAYKEFYNHELQPVTNEFLRRAETIGRCGLAYVDSTYGEGEPWSQPGINNLRNHNGHHARQVGEGALAITRALDLPLPEQITALTAGYVHDREQGPGHEERNAKWLEFQMRSRGFGEQRINIGKKAIQATRCTFDGGMVVNQAANTMEFYSKEEELVAKSVASGDFSDLFQPYGPHRAHDLLLEILNQTPDDEFPLERVIAFQEGQVMLTSSYQYPLKIAEEILATHRPEVEAYAQHVLDRLRAGTIESWDELLALDDEFAHQHDGYPVLRAA